MKLHQDSYFLVVVWQLQLLANDDFQYEQLSHFGRQMMTLLIVPVALLAI